MRKKRSISRKIRLLSYILTTVMGLLQPCTVLAAAPDKAASNTSDGSTQNIKYITAFEALSEDDSYFSCMYKPTLEELTEVFPTALSVQLEGVESFTEIEVTWECEDDFDDSEYLFYIFYPKWDETKYVLADSVKDTIELPFIMVEVPAGLITDLEEAQNSLKEILEEKSILALVYLCDKYEVKENASYDGTSLTTVTCGQSVMITGVDLDENGNIWYQITFYQNGTEYTGFIERDYLATSDEDLAVWEETYINFAAMPMVMALSADYPDIDQFPSSYQNALYALKEAHPNWIFVKMDTGLDWNTVIANEMGDKSLVHSSCSGSWQNGTYGQGWSYASEGILKYYMDPRNFLSDPSIFQFEQLTYNDSYHTTEAVQEIIKSSFMSSTIPGDSRTYAQAFKEIGQSLGISPFHLASRVLQEQGSQGTSPLISGSYSGYAGYYNYFNVGASGRTNQEVIVSGLQTAKAKEWDTRYKSLNGGASVIGANYITKGQDTLYLEKFNVSNGQHANFTHQYMQNIQAPASEAANVRKAYYNAGALENSFVFKIPVYKNMPASACPKPDTTDSLTLDKTSISNLEVDKTEKLTPYINGSKVDNVNDMKFASSNAAVATVDSQGKITAVAPGTATISCSRSGANTASCSVTVVKATPNVTTPTLSPITYKEGLKLSEVSLPEGWAWEKGDTAIKAGTVSYPAVYTPSDTTKYSKVTKEISFTVTKAIPDCQVPENLSAKTGSQLGSITLPKGFTWESNTETELKEAGEYTFYVSYNPDESNYYTVSHIPVVVQAIGADIEDGDNVSSSSSTTTSSGSSTTTSSGSTTSTSSGSTTTSSGSSTSTSSGSTTTSSGSTTTTSSGSSTSTSSGSTGSTTTSSGSTTTTSSGSSTTTSSGSTGSTTTSSGSSTTTSSGSSTSTSSGSSTVTSSGSSTTTSSGSTTTTSSGSSTTTSSGSTTTSSSGSTTTSSGSSTTTSSGSSTTTSSGSSTTTSSRSTTTSSGSSTTTSSSGSTTTTSSGSSTTTTSSGSTGSSTTTSSGSSTTTTSSGSSTSTSSSSSTTTSSGSTGSSTTSSGSTVTSNADNSKESAANTGNTAVTSTASTEKESTVTTPVQNTNIRDSLTTITGTSTGKNNKTITDGAVAVDSQTVLNAEDFQVEESAQETEEITFAKPSVVIEMDDTTILTVEKLQVAKEKDFILELNMGNQAVWSIDAASADLDALTSIDMGITFGANDIPIELINEVADGNEYLQFTLAHDGAFGFEAILEVALNPEDCGRYANLFYYNPETKQLEFVCDTIIDAEGKAHFQMDHASSYVIIVSDQSLEGLLESDGENGIIKWIMLGVFIFMLLVVIGYGTFFFWKKKQEEDEEEDAEDDEEEKPVRKESTEEKAQIGKKKAEQQELESIEMSLSTEDDWIEDKDWKEPVDAEELKSDPEPEPGMGSEFADDHAEDDWIDDDEWDIGNDWMDDAEWEKKKQADKAKEQKKE